jgi:hypothetical protein
MLTINRVPVVGTSGTYFVGSLAQNAALNARIPLPQGVGAGGSARSTVESITVVSADQLDWEFWFWSNKTFQNSGHPDLEGFLGFWSFAVAGGDGKRIAGTGLYYYYIDALGIPYQDLDKQPDKSEVAYLNVTLVNRSAGAKTDGAWFQPTFVLQPTIGA